MSDVTQVGSKRKNLGLLLMIGGVGLGALLLMGFLKEDAQNVRDPSVLMGLLISVISSAVPSIIGWKLISSEPAPGQPLQRPGRVSPQGGSAALPSTPGRIGFMRGAFVIFGGLLALFSLAFGAIVLVIFAGMGPLDSVAFQFAGMFAGIPFLFSLFVIFVSLKAGR